MKKLKKDLVLLLMKQSIKLKFRSPLESKLLQQNNYFFILLAIGIVQFYFSSHFWNKYLPLTEGWWHVYARWISEGRIPYRDFELLTPPLYPLLINFLSFFKIDSFSDLRFIGIILHVFINLTLYLIASKFTSKTYSLIISILISIYLQSGVAFINYDYIYVNILFFLISILSLLNYLSSKRNSLVFSAGLLVSLSFLIKQSQGIIYTASVLFFVLILAFRERSPRTLAGFFAGQVTGFLPFVIWLRVNNAFDEFLKQTIFYASQSKGGLEKSLFSWIKYILSDISNLTNNFTIFLTIVLSISLVSVIFQKFNFLRIILPVSLAFFYFFFIKNIESTMFISEFNKYVFSVALITMLFGFLMLPYFYSKNLGFSYLLISSIAVAWACGTSAGLTEIGIYFALFVFLIGLYLLINNNLVLINLTLLILISFFGVEISSKISTPYQWWGYSVGIGKDPSSYIQNPTVGKIYLPLAEKTLVEDVTQVMQNGLKCSDNSFVFPHMPIFQLMTNSLPDLYQATNWLDFSSAYGLSRNFKSFQEAKPGSIVMVDLPEFVWEGHSRLFNNSQPLPHLNVKIDLEEYINSNDYDLVFEEQVPKEYKIRVYNKVC
jgi:hypothetical protein